ncbi:hypothetical protein EWM62_06195 [Mucilaginibacter terrigena]|uniref:Uncharacterized protein n=1 Tax=Mucilaginibacter terrigena TaxID=2492395 RepID=A0A4Q5LQ25_9SPHI|nr:hypothetical protein [Mucilaginibacter terrigena]RYU91527.1 hypothetical protein EWM62_06195 [Mucilaginibacter terrigena]
MKKILLLLCILSVALSSKAQLFGKHYDEGYYYDSVGVKHTGLISWSPPAKSIFGNKGDNIFFKTDKKAEKIKLKNIELRSFSIKNDSARMDSFVVATNKDFEKAPFLQVLLDNNVKIYGFTMLSSSGGGMMMGAGGNMVMTPSFSSSDTKYYYGSDPDHTTRLDKKNFIEVMSKALASKPYVVKRVQDKTFKISKLNELLYFYRTDNYPQSMQSRNN